MIFHSFVSLPESRWSLSHSFQASDTLVGDICALVVRTAGVAGNQWVPGGPRVGGLESRDALMKGTKQWGNSTNQNQTMGQCGGFLSAKPIKPSQTTSYTHWLTYFNINFQKVSGSKALAASCHQLPVTDGILAEKIAGAHPSGLQPLWGTYVILISLKSMARGENARI